MALCTCAQKSTDWARDMARSVELEVPTDEALALPRPLPHSQLFACSLSRYLLSLHLQATPQTCPLATVIVNRDLSNVSGVTVQETVVFVVVVLI